MKKGTSCTIPAHNLASNVLGGFKEVSTAHRGCRHCLATPSEMKSVFRESQLQLRKSFEHSACCDQLYAATFQREQDNLSTEFGINRRSILDSLYNVI